MKKPVKITLIIFAVLIALVAAAFVTVDVWVSKLVHREVAATFDRISNAEASVGDIQIFLFSGTAIVKDIYFETNSISINDTTDQPCVPGMTAYIPSLTIGRVSYTELFRKKHLWLYSITVDNPTLRLFIDEKDPTAILPEMPEDTTLEKAGLWLKRADIRHINVNNFHAEMQSTRTPLKLRLDSLTTACRDFAYDFSDSVFLYNDSVYDIHFSSFTAELPDGISAVEIHDFETKDEGSLNAGRTRYWNTVSLKRLADKAKEPVSWMDLELISFHTSAFNPLHKILDKDYTLDSLAVNVKKMHVMRDERYAPKKPFPTPQEFLRSLPVQFEIKHAEAKVREIDIDYASTNVNCGKMMLKNLRATMAHVTNRPGAVWYSKAHAPMGKEGVFDAQFNMHLDKASTFDLALHGQKIEANYLNSFIRPLVGITCECFVDRLDAEYKGDKSIAKGDFCLQYHGLKVQVHQEDDIPYKIVTKHAKTFNQLANTLIPKSNPTVVDIRPRSYTVEWKRDEWKPYPLYVFGPCIKGTVETMLPGVFVHKQSKYSHAFTPSRLQTHSQAIKK